MEKECTLLQKNPKTAFKNKNTSLLENSIKFLISIGIKHIIINTHYLHKQIFQFFKKK